MPATLILTPALADSLADAVRRGVPIETAATAAGISKTQFYYWLQAAEREVWPDGTPIASESLVALSAFSEQIKRAEAQWEADHVKAIGEAGAVIGKSGVPEWRARAFLLTNHPRTRSRWGQQVQIEQTGTVQHEHSLVKQLPPTELEAAYEALRELPQTSSG